MSLFAPGLFAEGLFASGLFVGASEPGSITGTGALSAAAPLIEGVGERNGDAVGTGDLQAAVPAVAGNGILGVVTGAVTLTPRIPRINALVAVNGVFPSAHGLLPRARRRTLRSPLRCTLKVSNG